MQSRQRFSYLNAARIAASAGILIIAAGCSGAGEKKGGTAGNSGNVQHGRATCGADPARTDRNSRLSAVNDERREAGTGGGTV